MEVEAITKYKLKGEEFNSLKDIKEHLHNKIGLEVIDTINRKVEIKHRDLFTLLEIICSPPVRKTLLNTLNVTFETVEDFNNGHSNTEIINVLDIKD